MPAGIPISRQWMLVLNNGTVVIDWGDGLYQDIRSDAILRCSEADISHTIQEIELEELKRTGQIRDFDGQNVYVFSLSERPTRPIRPRS